MSKCSWAFCGIAALGMATLIILMIFNLLSGLKKETCLERHLNDTGIVEQGGCRFIKVVFVSRSDCESIIPNLRNSTMDTFKKELMEDPETKDLTDCILAELNKTKAAEYQMTLAHVKEHYLYRHFQFAGNSSVVENATVALENLKVQSLINCKADSLLNNFYRIQDVVPVHDEVIHFESKH